MSNNGFVRKISNFITKHHLLCEEGKYLVGLSGGADSVALLCVLQTLGYKIEAAHCNFHLRGEESERDADFCINLCKEKGISLHKTDFDTRSYAAAQKISIEMAARELRYQFFDDLKNQCGFNKICIAHHRDDSVETLLINLIRGTGIHGLTGISHDFNDIVRPFLGVYRTEIEQFLQEINQPFITDSSNLENDVVRNKIRLDVLPLLQTINPSVNKSIFKTANRMNDVAKILDEVMEKKVAELEIRDGEQVTIPIELIDNELYLFYSLEKYGFTSSQIEQIYDSLHAPTGKTFISNTHELLFNRGHILVRRKPQNGNTDLIVPEMGEYSYSENDTFVFEEIDYVEGMSLNKGCKWALLDNETIAFPLTIRKVKMGDRFVPLGMRGTQLVSNYMTNRKKTFFEKQSQLVVTDANGHIVWLVDERPDQRFAITENTHRILSIHHIHLQ